MTFLPKDDTDSKPEKESSTPAPLTEPTKKKSGSPINSLIFLVLIGIALFYGRDFLSGEKEIPGLSGIVPEVTNTEDTPKKAELKIARVKDSNLRALLSEFKEAYDTLLPPEALLSTQPEVKIIRYSADKKSLLIELEQTNAESGERQSSDIVYKSDDFGRLVTTGALSSIKLHPEE